jgi:hypothetical protein
VKTPAQRISDAMQTVDKRAMDLLAHTERWSLTGRTIWDQRNDRVILFGLARSYANAVRRLARLKAS